MSETELGLLTDEDMERVSDKALPEQFEDIQGLGTAMKGFTAAKAGAWAGSAASQL